MKNAKELLFIAIKAKVFGEISVPPKNIDVETLKKLFMLSKKHDIAQIVCGYLEDNGLLNDCEIKNAFEKQKMLSIFRREQQNFEFSRICNAFEEAEIDFIPLKGSVLKSLYDEEWMRTSSDIDILVKDNDLKAALDITETKLGFVFDCNSLYEYSMISKNGVNFELHHHMKGPYPKLEETLKRIWEFSSPEDGKTHKYIQSNEFIAFYSIAHTLHHFLSGGCGIRPFIDMRLINKKLAYSKDVVSELLEQSGAAKFYKEISKLERVWFEGEEHSELTAMMEEFILTGGVYGNRLNYGAVKRHRSGNGLKFYLSRIFPPKNIIIQMSPKIERYPVLIPYYYVKRWFLLLDKKYRNAAKEEIKGSSNDRTAFMLRELGL